MISSSLSFSSVQLGFNCDMVTTLTLVARDLLRNDTGFDTHMVVDGCVSSGI